MDGSMFLTMHDDRFDIQENIARDLRLEPDRRIPEITALASPTKILDYDALNRWLHQKMSDEPWSSFHYINSGAGTGRQVRAKL
jgi:hypothetical protein